MTTGVTEDIVLSGTLDDFFKRDNVVFDRYTGNFLPRRANNRKVYLKADGILHHWTKNILERNGFSLTKDLNDAIFRIEVQSSEQVIVEYNTIKIEISSYEQLASFLRKHKTL